MYSDVDEVVHRNIYVVDCLCDESSENKALERTDALEVVLSQGGFYLRVITYWNDNPPESLSADRKSTIVGGLNQY